MYIVNIDPIVDDSSQIVAGFCMLIFVMRILSYLKPFLALHKE